MSSIDNLRVLIQNTCVQHGKFVLSSGIEKDFFIQLKNISLSPLGSFLLGTCLFNELLHIDVDAVGGMDFGATPLVTSVVLVSEFNRVPIPGFILRKEKKDHGLKESIIQSYCNDGTELLSNGRKVVLLDDVSSTGKTFLELINTLSTYTVEIVCVLSVVDRNLGSRELMKSINIPFKYIFDCDDNGNISYHR